MHVVRILCKSTAIWCSGPKVESCLDLDGYASKKKQGYFPFSSCHNSTQLPKPFIYSRRRSFFFFFKSTNYLSAALKSWDSDQVWFLKLCSACSHTVWEVWNRSLIALQYFLDYWSMEPLCGCCAFTSVLKEITHKHYSWASVCVVHTSFFRISCQSCSIILIWRCCGMYLPESLCVICFYTVFPLISLSPPAAPPRPPVSPGSGWDPPSADGFTVRQRERVRWS